MSRKPVKSLANPNPNPNPNPNQGCTEGLSRKPVKSLGELKYMSTLSRRTNLARARVRVAAVSAHRRLAPRSDAQQGTRVLCLQG